MHKDKDKSKGKRNYVIAAAVIVIIAVAVYMIIANTSSAVAASGDNVSVYYSGTFTNGTSFGSDFNATPINFTIGAGQMIPGFSNAVICMHVGQIKYITLQPSEAYGYVNQSRIITVSKSQFGNSVVTVGMSVTAPSGASGIITNISANIVTVDFNPPLAGKTLKFEIKLLKVHKG